MANDRNDAGNLNRDSQRDAEERAGDETEAAGHKHAGRVDRDRVIGKGMTSPDSTQMPLKAETGEPDYEALEDGARPKGSEG